MTTPDPRAGFRWFWTAETVTAVGSAVTTVALQVLVVTTLGGTAAEVGLLNASRFLPYLLLGLVVGALVDQWRRRPVLVTTDLLRAALLAVVPLLWWRDLLTLPALLAVVLVFGLVSLVNDAATQSFLPRLVPRGRLTAANARLDQGGTVAGTAGPALGGALVALVGAPLAVLVDAVSFLLSALLTARIAVEEPRTPRDRPRLHLRADIAEGLRWAYGHGTLAPLSLSTHVWFLANSVLTTVVVPYALLTLGLSSAGLGLALACAGVGGVAGAFLAAPVGQRVGTGRAVLVARVLAPLAVVVLVLAPTGSPSAALVVLCAGQLVYGLELGLSNPHEMGFRQAVTPDALQGRVNTSLRSINRAVVVVGAPLGGLLADRLGYRPTLLLAALVFVIAFGWLLSTPFRHVRLDPDDDTAMV